MSEILLDVRDITVRRGGRDRLSNASFSLAAGETLAIVGPNGAGKSTLLKAIAGELPLRHGTIAILGRTLAEWDPRELARVRGVLPQESTLTFPFTALEVVLMGRAPHLGKSSRRRDEEIARTALAEVQLDHAAHRLYPTLSGGERQRVHLARVLAQLWSEEPGEPRVLLLDEPVSNLDLAQQHRALDLARRVADEGGAAVAVLHDLNLAAQHADRIAVICRGELIKIGTPSEVMTEGLLQRAFGVEALILPHPCGDCPLIVSMPTRPGRGVRELTTLG